MSNDDRKLTYSERDKLRREGGEAPKGGRAKAEDARKTREALAAADSLFAGDERGREAKEHAKAVRDAHGTEGLAATCEAYVEAVGVPRDPELASIFLDANDKALRVAVLDALLAEKEAGELLLEGGLKRQIRILSEDFDDDLASRAEDLLE